MTLARGAKMEEKGARADLDKKVGDEMRCMLALTKMLPARC